MVIVDKKVELIVKTFNKNIGNNELRTRPYLLKIKYDIIIGYS